MKSELGITIGDIVPESPESISLPRALASRYCFEQLVFEERCRKYIGEDPKPVDQLGLSVRIAEFTPVFQRMLLKPAQAAKLYEQLIAARITDSAQGSNEEKSPLDQLFNPEAFGELFTHIVMKQMKSYESGSVQRIVRSLTKAEDLAHEWETTPATVYIDDSLYMELVRQTSSPNDFLKSVETLDDIFTVRNMIQSLIEAFSRSLAPELINDPEALQIVTDAFNTKKFKESIGSFIVNYRRAMLLATRDSIDDFWGQEGIALLTPERRDRLMSVE